MNDKILKDPRYLYHDHEFPEQDSMSPPIQEEMTPKPDCGESSYQGSQRLVGRNALITGADSGIGRAAAIAYAREGANVAIHYFPGEEADAESLKELIEGEGRMAITLPGDFRHQGEATRVFEEALDYLGTIDILVMNAAIQYAQANLSDFTLEQVNDTYQVNIISMFEMIQAAEPHLHAGSSVITTTSVQSFDPSPHLLDYASTNSAISNFTIGLARYFADKGVRVNSVAPGPIWTPLQLDGGQLPGGVPKFGQNSLLKRAGQPVELAPVYVFLASDEASYVTAQIYGVTGGKNICISQVKSEPFRNLKLSHCHL